MIQELINPKTVDYINFKNNVLSTDFPWHWHSSSLPPGKTTSGDLPFLSHVLLRPPSGLPYNNMFPLVSSDYFEQGHRVLREIVDNNKIRIKTLLRINLNMTLPQPPPFDSFISPLHVDHDFPHKNLLVYLNNTDGDTITYSEENQLDFPSKTEKFENVDLGNPIRYSPKEDAVILYDGWHHMQYPTIGKRIIMIVTFLER